MKLFKEKPDRVMTSEKVQDSSTSDDDYLNTEANHDVRSVPANTPDNANIFSQGDKNYRTLGRWDTVFCLFANQIGLGILSLPSVLNILGIVPGIIAIIGIGCLSWYTAFELLQFYANHPHVVNMVDMTRVVGGPWFEMVAGFFMMIQVVFVASSAAVTLSIALNTMSSHATCTVVFIFVACLVCWMLSMPRTMKFVSYSGIPNAVSVMVAVFIVIISLGVSGPAAAPPGWDKKIVVFGHPDFRDGLNCCLKIVYAYAGNIAFVGYMAEMKDPVADFGFCLTFLEVGSMILYVVVAIIVYCLSGQFITSPALGAAPVILSKVAYGIIIPAVVATGLAYGHIGGKYLFVIVMRRIGAINQVTDNSFKAWSIWTTCVTSFWILVFILSNAIPIFDSILSITSATTISWFTFGLSSVFWFHHNQKVLFRDWKKMALMAVNALLIIMSLFMNAAGLWSSITELLDLFDADDSSIQGAFSCGNNA
ncbi:hypothetical protein G7046_g8526 [Stylonectria norvegica]|nr:hypothetical protein G7046_g8526 [Stylonectria norvegica]